MSAPVIDRPPLRRAETWAPLALGILLASMVAARLEVLVGGLAAAIALAAWAGAPMPRRSVWTGLAVTMAIAIVLNLYLVRGHELLLPRIAGLSATREGARLGLTLALRIAGASAAMRALAAMWPGERAADELAGSLRPLSRLGVPVAGARAVLGLALRFTPLLGEEWRRIAALQAQRAGRPAVGLSERLTRLRAAIVPALVGALERAERVALALEARHHRVRPSVASRWAWPPAAAGAGWALTAMVWRT